MPEMHLRQLGFTYSACRPFTKSKERIKKLKKQEIHNIYIYKLLAVVLNVRICQFRNYQKNYTKQLLENS